MKKLLLKYKATIPSPIGYWSCGKTSVLTLQQHYSEIVKGHVGEETFTELIKSNRCNVHVNFEVRVTDDFLFNIMIITSQSNIKCTTPSW